LAETIRRIQHSSLSFFQYISSIVTSLTSYHDDRPLDNARCPKKAVSLRSHHQRDARASRGSSRHTQVRACQKRSGQSSNRSWMDRRLERWSLTHFVRSLETRTVRRVIRRVILRYSDSAELKLMVLSSHLPGIDINAARHRSRETHVHSECQDKAAIETRSTSRAV
jgi:hypothetical protein